MHKKTGRIEPSRFSKEHYVLNYLVSTAPTTPAGRTARGVLAAIEDRLLHVLGAAKALLHVGAGDDVLQLGLRVRRPLARLDMLPRGDNPDLSFHHDRHAGLQVLWFHEAKAPLRGGAMTRRRMFRPV